MSLKDNKRRGSSSSMMEIKRSIPTKHQDGLKNLLRKMKQNQPDSEDDDDEEEDDEEEEEEDENVWETDSNSTKDSTHKKKSKSKNLRKKHISEDEEEDDESEDEEDEEDEKLMRQITKEFVRRRKSMDDKKQKKEIAAAAATKKHRRVKSSRVEVLDESDSEDDEDDEEDDDYEEISGKNQKNIVIMLGGNDGDDGYYENQDNVDNAEIEQSLDFDDDDCNSEDEKNLMKEDYQPVEYPKEQMLALMEKNNKKNKKNKKNTLLPLEEEEADEMVTVEDEYKDLIDLKKHLSDKLKINPKSKILLRTMTECRESISKLVKKTRTKNAKDYYKLIKVEPKNATTEIDYFKKKLSHKEQKAIMNELKVINEHINIDKPYRLALLQTKLPPSYKATVMQKLNVMRTMESGDSEYHKMKSWVDTFMRIPFNLYKSLDVRMSDGVDVCDKFMKHAKQHLDDCVYGLDDAKLQIQQMIGQWITNPGAMGSAIAICGPPGTGKTSLAKEGISKILGREFAFIALGGTGDSSFLEGHSYTYEGSSWGKIVQILIDSKCMNPVIYFDELDKLSDSARGQEITGILTHLIDKSQNSQFHDKYFSEVEFDLSKCLFIFSYNDENAVNPILRDRMYRIKTKGYDCAEKVVIAKKYMLPKIREQVNFQEGDIVIPDDVLQYIISTPRFTQNEEGVRNLNRCLEIIHTKLNLFRLMHTGADDAPILGKKANIKVSFPYTVTKKDVDILIHNEENQNQSLLAMYV